MPNYNFSVYKLKFKSPVHFADAMADYGHSLNIYHSDSMYAALTAAIATVSNNLQAENPYTISSLFPYAQAKDGSIVYFFPKPLNYYKIPRGQITQHKKFKKIAWLDQHYFTQVINGNSLYEIADLEHIRFNEFLSQKDLIEPVSQKWVAARVQVPRYIPGSGQKQDARPFYMERVQFYESAGLYFMALGDNEHFELLEKQLSILQDFGLGTDRNVGNGHFIWERDSISLDLPESDYLLNCGMYIPRVDEFSMPEFSHNLLSFRIQRRGGWITTPPFNSFRKNDIYAFDVGSIIKYAYVSTPVSLGRMVDLTPPAEFIKEKMTHPILRNGKTIFLPIKTYEKCL